MNWRYKLVALASAFILTACSGGGASDSSNSKITPPDPAILPFTFIEAAPADSALFIEKQEAKGVLTDIIGILELTAISLPFDALRASPEVSQIIATYLGFDASGVGTLRCLSGKKREVDNRNRSTGRGTLSQYFYECDTGDLIYHGSIHYRVTSSRSSVEFDHFAYYDGLGFFSGINGLISQQGDMWHRTGSADFMLVSSVTGPLILENYRFDYPGPSATAASGRGRFHYGSDGYVDFRYDNTNVLRVSGSQASVIQAELETDYNRGDTIYLSYQSSSTSPALQVSFHESDIPIAFADNNEEPTARVKPVYINTIGSTIYPRIESGGQLRISSLESSDPNFDFLDFEWQIVSQPENCSYQLIPADSSSANFASACPGNYVLELTAADSTSASTTNITIEVKAPAPTFSSLTPQSPNISDNATTSIAFDVSNPNGNAFTVGIMPPFNLMMDIDSAQNEIHWQPQLPMNTGSETLKLPVYINDGDFHVSSVSQTVSGDNIPLYFTSGIGRYAKLSMASFNEGIGILHPYNFRGEPGFGPAFMIAGDYMEQQWTYPLFSRGLVDSTFFQFDHDNIFDILILTENDIIAINSDAIKLYEWNGVCDGFSEELTAKAIRTANIDADDELELIVQCGNTAISVFELGVQTRQLAYENATEIKELVIGGIDDDESDELVLIEKTTLNPGTFTVLNYPSGTTENSLPGITGLTTLADPDGDEKLQLLVTQFLPDEDYFYINAFNVLNWEIAEQTYTVNWSTWSNPYDALTWRDIDGIAGDELIWTGSGVSLFDVADDQIHLVEEYDTYTNQTYVSKNPSGGDIELFFDHMPDGENSVYWYTLSSGNIESVPAPQQDQDIITWNYASGCRPTKHTYHNKETRKLSVFLQCDQHFYRMVIDLESNKVLEREKRLIDDWHEFYQVTDINNDGSEELLYQYQSVISLYDWKSGTILFSKPLGELENSYIVDVIDMNDDGNLDLLLHRSIWGEDTDWLYYYDLHDSQAHELNINHHQYALGDQLTASVGYAVNPYTRDMYILSVADSHYAITQFSWDGEQYNLHQQVLLGTDFYAPSLNVGDLNSDGHSEIYIKGRRASPNVGTRIVILDEKLNLIEDRLIPRRFGFFEIYPVEGLGDLFISYEEFYNDGRTFPRHDNERLFLMSPFMNEEMWRSEPLRIDFNTREAIVPFVDEGTFRLLLLGDYGFYITR